MHYNRFDEERSRAETRERSTEDIFVEQGLRAGTTRTDDDCIFEDTTTSYDAFWHTIRWYRPRVASLAGIARVTAVSSITPENGAGE